MTVGLFIFSFVRPLLVLSRVFIEGVLCSMKEYRKTLIGSCSMMYLYAMTVGLLPVALVAMSQSIGFTLTGGGGLSSVGDVVILMVLVASGFLAAKIGKIRAIILGGWILTLALVLCGFSNTYGSILGWSILAGVGKGLIEALLNPLVDDLSEGDGGRAINVVNGFFSIGVCTSALLFGELLNLGLNWRILYFVAAVVSAMNTSLFTVLRPHASLYKDKVEALHLGRIAKNSQVLFLGIAIFAGAGVEGVLTFWSASYIQLGLGEGVRVAAIGTALFAGAMAVGRISCGRLAPKFGLWRILVITGLCGSFVVFAMFFTKSLGLFYLLLILAGLSIAPAWPSIQSYAARRLPELDATMLMIVLSLWGVPGFSISVFLIGRLGDLYGLQWGFILITGLFLLMVGSLLLERKLFQKRAET